MSGKSKLKEIFRSHFPDSIHYYNAAECPIRDGFVSDGCAPTITVVFEDASVRYAGGAFAGDGSTGLDAVRAFLQPVADVFATYESVHTYVMCFDKKCFVPTHKAHTQAKRVAALQRAAGTWQWDGASDIVHPEQYLPPWKDVRASPDTYKRALHDLIYLLQTHARVPPHKRLIIDAETPDGFPLVILGDTDTSGVVRTSDVTLANQRGEADIVAQLIVSGTYFARDGAAMSYPLGSAVVRTVDTDYLPLGLLASLEATHRSYLCIGRISLCPTTGAVVTRANGVSHHELYDMVHLRDAIVTWTQTQTNECVEARTAITSFVTLCIACGNDYVERPRGLTHPTLWAAYQWLTMQGMLLTRVVEHQVVVLPGAFSAMILVAYGIKFKVLTGAPNVYWADMSARVLDTAGQRFKNVEDRCMSEERMLAYYQSVSDALQYGLTGAFPVYEE